MNNKIHFYKLCKSKFCNYGTTFKISLNRFDERTNMCILTTSQKEAYSFISPQYMLKTHLDFDVAFSRETIRLIRFSYSARSGCLYLVGY